MLSHIPLVEYGINGESVSSKQDALAALGRSKLRRDDESDPGGRVYWDEEGNQYHSVTRILSETAPVESKEALRKWLERPGSTTTRDIAATRGTLTHNAAEYVLKTAAKLSRKAANRRGVWRTSDDGLERCPAQLFRWGLSKALDGAPNVPWSAAGYARGLKAWIADNVTAVHGIEFSIHHPAGFAGTCDALIDVAGTLTICDWKTSERARNESMLRNYIHQAGAYSLGLESLTGIRAEAGAIVVARRSGSPQVRFLTRDELDAAEADFLERANRYFSGGLSQVA